jgi:hypothetical protein
MVVFCETLPAKDPKAAGQEPSSFDKQHANEFFAAPPDLAAAKRAVGELQGKTLGQQQGTGGRELGSLVRNIPNDAWKIWAVVVNFNGGRYPGMHPRVSSLLFALRQ